MKKYYEDNFNNNVEIGQDELLIAPIEIGGMNSLIPLIFGATENIKVVDCDFMGRAYPSLNYCSPIWYKKKFFPICLSNDNLNKEKGFAFIHENEIIKNKELIGEERYDTTNYLWDEMIKKILGIIMPWSCIAAISFFPYKKEVLDSISVKYTLSRARNLGEAISLARINKKSVKEVFEKLEDTRFIFKGKIVFVDKQLNGFSEGRITIFGLDRTNSEYYLDILFRNEIILARKRKLNEDFGNGEILSAVPDIITILDQDSYEPILVEMFTYGLKVNVITIPINDLVRNKKELTGLSSFGINEKYELLKPSSNLKYESLVNRNINKKN